MLKIRLRRMGSRHRPFYRVVVSDSRRAPKSSALDEIGYYDPRRKPAVLTIDVERYEHWTDQGAQASETIQRLVKRVRKHGNQAATSDAPAAGAADAAPVTEASEAATAEAAEAETANQPEATTEETAVEATAAETGDQGDQAAKAAKPPAAEDGEAPAQAAES